MAGKKEIKEGDVLVVFDYMKFPNEEKALDQARKFGYKRGKTERILILEVKEVIPLPD